MKKGNTLVMAIIVIVSVALVVGIAYMLLNEESNINQGRFRINDIEIKSMVDAEDKTIDLNNWELNLNQKNHVAILIDKEANSTLSKIYIDEIQVENPEKTGNFYILPKDSKTNYDLKTNEKTQIEVFVKEQAGCYLAELDINNDEFLTGYKIPSTEKQIVLDGTLLSRVNVPVEQLHFKISFNLNIIDIQGNLNTAKIVLNAPEAELASAGSVQKKVDVKDFGFKIVE